MNESDDNLDIGEVIDLTESDGTDEHNQASPNFMKVTNKTPSTSTYSRNSIVTFFCILKCQSKHFF